MVWPIGIRKTHEATILSHFLLVHQEQIMYTYVYVRIGKFLLKNVIFH